MISKKEIRDKIFINGTLRVKLPFIQKYLTQDEIEWVNTFCKGNTFAEKIWSLSTPSKVIVKTKSKPIKKVYSNYVYKGIPFDKPQALIYYILSDGTVTLNTTDVFFFLDSKNKKHRYMPLFRCADGILLDIETECGFEENYWPYKKAIAEANNFKFITLAEMKIITSVFYKKFGGKYLKQFKKKRDKDFKRTIIEVENESDIKSKVFEKRNANVKIKFYCKSCGAVDYQSPKTVLHFNNLLCGSCRRKHK